MLAAIAFVLVAISIAQYITCVIFYYRFKSAKSAETESLNTKTFGQVKKELKKQNVKINKRDFKNSTPAALLEAATSVTTDGEPVSELIFPGAESFLVAHICLVAYRKFEVVVGRGGNREIITKNE